MHVGGEQRGGNVREFHDFVRNVIYAQVVLFLALEYLVADANPRMRGN